MLPKHELPQQALTYSGIGVFHPEFFAQIDGLNSEISAAGAVKLALRPLLDRTIASGTLTAEQWSGQRSSANQEHYWRQRRAWCAAASLFQRFGV